jgi:hypothetical protein
MCDAMTTLRSQAKRLGVSAPALCKRLKTWDPERALSTPKQPPDAPRDYYRRPQPWSPIQREPEVKSKCLGDILREQAEAEGRIGSPPIGCPSSDGAFIEHWRPKVKAPAHPNVIAGQRRRREREREQRPDSIRTFAAELIKIVDHTDQDGREWGLSYDVIRDRILRKFPTVKSGGPHQGKPTVAGFDVLHEIAWALKRDGIKLPLRPRRPRSDAGERRAKATARPAGASGRRVASDTGRASPANSRHRRHGHNPTNRPSPFLDSSYRKRERWATK